MTRLLRSTVLVSSLLLVFCVLNLKVSADFNPQIAPRTFHIDSVFIEGNEKTKSEFLLPFVSEDLIRKRLTEQQIENTVNRLVLLPQVYAVEYELIPKWSEDILANHVIKIIIQEAKTSFPILNFGGVKGNFWTRAGWKDFNMLGQGISWGALHQYDQRHSFSGYFQLPQGLFNEFGYSVDFNSRHTMEPLFIDDLTAQYKYDYNGGMIAINRAINSRRTRGELGIGGFEERFKLEDPEADPRFPPLSELPKWLFKLRLDHKDVRQSGLNVDGVKCFAQLETVYTPAYKTWYHVFRSEWSGYWSVTKTTNLAGRLMAGLATNTDSPIAPFVLDSYINIRGTGNIVSRGSGSAVLNLEVRQQVFGYGNWMVQAIAFSDYGAWRMPGGSFADFTNPDILQHFVGGGIRIAYLKVYNATLRLDYGIDIMHKEKKGFVVGLAQYF